ncbi:MAG: peptidase [Cellvibrionaceae bacterium]|nr:peptidase [Cellvibrionaceae bacterium]
MKLMQYAVAVLVWGGSFSPVSADTAAAVADHYGAIAHAVYSDALMAAKVLNRKIDQLVSAPSASALAEAKAAWQAARIPYQQSEVFRFGNSIVDDWEGQVNGWPLDEGLIDYVAAEYTYELGNVGATANIIANHRLTLGNNTLDLQTITPALLAELNELGGSEANVATGYHALEFLLWGQDLNGTGPGAGQRPYTDFSRGAACTHGHCDRRSDYLQAVSALLLTDLQAMVAQWAPNTPDNYRAAFVKLPAQEALGRMLYGMASLSLGELAGERMQVALTANSPEEEHDCFSDNTHFSHFYNARGVSNIYLGRYQRLDGSLLHGPSIASLVAGNSKAVDAELQAKLAATEHQLQKIVDSAQRAQHPMKFDQMIAPGAHRGRALITDAIAALVAQTRAIDKAAAVLGLAQLHPDIVSGG